MLCESSVRLRVGGKARIFFALSNLASIAFCIRSAASRHFSACLLVGNMDSFLCINRLARDLLDERKWDVARLHGHIGMFRNRRKSHPVVKDPHAIAFGS